AMTHATEPAKASPEAGAPTARRAVPRADVMPMYERMLELYLRQLGLDGQPMTLTEAELARARRGRRPGAGAPAGSRGARLRERPLGARPPVDGRRRCRSHGCAPHAGAPEGNSNALKHGRFTAKEVAKGRRIEAFIRECRETLRDVNKASQRSR